MNLKTQNILILILRLMEKFYGKKNLIAKLFKNSEITNPKIKVFLMIFFKLQKKIELRIRKCFEYYFSNNIGFIKKINLIEKSSSNLRAVIYSLVENLGHCKKENVNTLL